LPSKANTADQQTQLDYIIKYRETAEKEMKKSGIPASISIAQGIIESKSGSSELVKSSKNHFGIRDGSKYRTYQSDLESWADHSKVLNLPIYRQLKGKNYKQWAIGLEKIGYATDPMYAEKLIEVIERWGLQALDTIPS
jgi:flagellum-specific peptidoglycan hydrolase FlgJ